MAQQTQTPEQPEPKLTIKRQRHRAQYFTEDLGNGIGLDMVLIPGGSFLMGSPEDELERSESEGPQRTVTVPHFFLGKYSVTQAQWQAVLALPQVNRELESDPSKFKGNDPRGNGEAARPVENVSWYDAVEFCDRLSQLTGRPYRLPSEAEWEYACRAGTTTPFHFGETITTDLANYDGTDDPDGRWSGSYGRGPKGIYRQETTTVGSFGVANAFGLFDMHGNVWEWCLDHWHSNYEGAPTDGSAWITDNEEASRLLRGGSWKYDPRNCRSASRSYYVNFPDSRNYNIGFRVVCAAARTLG
jgi:formylglycine-generating enzyme required for sulfatase activity